MGHSREREREQLHFSRPTNHLQIDLFLFFSFTPNQFFILRLLRNKKAEKMISSLMIVLLALAGSQAAKLTSTGVDLEPIFEFLDNDGSGGVNSDELKELTVAGDEDGDGIVTAAEFQAAWEDIAVGFGVPAEKHSKYFGLLTVLMEPRTTAKSPKLKIRRFLAKLTPMEMEKSAWTSSSLKYLRSSKRFHGEISTGQRLLHLLFNSLIDSRFDFFLSFFLQILTFPILFSKFFLYS